MGSRVCVHGIGFGYSVFGAGLHFRDHSLIRGIFGLGWEFVDLLALYYFIVAHGWVYLF